MSQYDRDVDVDVSNRINDFDLQRPAFDISSFQDVKILAMNKTHALDVIHALQYAIRNTEVPSSIFACYKRLRKDCDLPDESGHGYHPPVGDEF